MPSRFKSVTGFVLAGGASRRMGRPKALLVLGGETMIERQVRLLRAVAGNVFVAGWQGKSSTSRLPGILRELSLLPDELPGRGPLAGIYTGLKKARTEYNLFLGCDMPFVDSDFLEFLCARALDTAADVTVPKSRQRWLIPVCAVYRRRAREVIRKSLEAGENKITRFFPRVRCEVIPWRVIARAGFGPAVLDNINTPQDFEAARKRLS